VKATPPARAEVGLRLEIVGNGRVMSIADAEKAPPMVLTKLL
jgi:hypothetical protein